MKLYDPRLSFRDRSLTFDSNHCITNYLLHYQLFIIYNESRKKSEEKKFSEQTNVAKISTYVFVRMSKKENNHTYAMWLKDFERLTNESIDDRASEFTADVIVITSKDYKKFFQKLKKKLITLKELRIKVFKTYHKWINV